MKANMARSKRGASKPQEGHGAAMFQNDRVPQKGNRRTSSRWFVFYLTRFGGYCVVLKKQTPIQGSFGMTTYRNVWHLRKKSK